MCQKRNLFVILAAVIMLAFIFYPAPKTEIVHLRLYFSEDYSLPNCNIYYGTSDDPELTGDKTIWADTYDSIADFTIPTEIYEDLSLLRLDFTETEEYICIKYVEIRSAGFAKKSYAASEFFDSANILSTNDISAMNSLNSFAYIRIDGNDPYIFFQDNITDLIRNSGTDYRITRLLLCIFAAAAVWFSHKKIFTAEKPSRRAEECL